MFLKHLGFLYLPMTSSGTFSPIILAHTITVIRSLLSLPPLHVSPLRFIVLSGRHFQNSPVSSALNTSSGRYSASSEGRVRDSQSLVISGVTEADSPHTLRECLLLKRSSQPLLQRKSRCPRASASSWAFTCKMVPDTGTFMHRAWLNHSSRASSISLYLASRRRLRVEQNFDESKASLMSFLLLYRRVTVLRAIQNSSAIAERLLSPFSTVPTFFERECCSVLACQRD